MPENKFYKYSLKLRWPAICRNRSIQILKERPDLVEQMNHFRDKASTILKIICRKSFSVDNSHSMAGVRIHFEAGQDVYEFIIRQPEFDWEVVPEINVINILTRQIQTFNIVYTPTGVVID